MKSNRSLTSLSRAAKGRTDPNRRTRDRILDEAIRLFADRGFQSTTVGDIERAVGLAPRAGGFYRHYKSKEEVFQACVTRWLEEIRSFGTTITLLPLEDLRSELTLIVHGSLQLLARQRDLFRMLARDADHFPRLVKKVHADLVSQGYRMIETRFAQLLRERGSDPADARPLAAIALGSIVHYRDDEALYGKPPADASEESFVRMWVEVLDRFFSVESAKNDTSRKGRRQT